MSKAQEIARFYDQLKGKRYNFDTLNQEVVDYIAPHNADIVTLRSPGEKKTQAMYDSTAGYGSHVFSQFVQGSVFNQSTKWFSLAHREPDANSKQSNAEWLNQTRDKILAMMRTSFYGPAGQSVNSWTLFGNGPLLIEDVPKTRDSMNPIRYTSVPWGQYVMSEGDDGRVDQFIRCLKLPANIAVKLGDVSDDIRNAADKDPLKEFEILHSILPRDFQESKRSKIKLSKDFDWASVWVEKNSKGPRIIKEGGYRKFPVAIARFDILSGETYARGPGHLALPDAKSLNEADRKAQLKWDRELDPPTLTRRNSIVSKILDKRAGGDTIVSDPNNSVKPLFEGSNWQAHDHMAVRKEQAILRVFHVNEILNLLAREKPEMTAFEVNARLTLLQQILGPIFGLLEAEFLSVIVDVTMDNMAHQGLLDAPPDDIGDISQPDGLFDVIYEGPLARAQRNGEILAVQQMVADIQGLATVNPEILLIADTEKAARMLAEIRGTQELLKSEREYTADVNAQREAQNAEKALAVAAGGAEALGKAAPGLRELRESGEGRAAA